MSKKSYNSCYNIFSFIKNLFGIYSIDVDFNKIYFMIDFEKASRRTLKDIFPLVDIKSCYFHYAKALWAKAKKLGLTRKKISFDTYKLIFAFKLYQFIPEKDKKEYLNNINSIHSDKIEYKTFLKYFTKNWSDCNFLNFQNLDKEQINERTDNISENFNRNSNKLIGRTHPKVSYLIEKLKNLTVKQYNSFIENRILKIERATIGYNFYNDNFNFFLKVKEKYKKSLSINMIKEFDKEEIDNLKNISIKLINEFLNIKIDDDNIDKDNKSIKIEELIDDNEPQIMENENILNQEDEKKVSDEKYKDRKENDNLFDIEDKQKKKNKKIEFTDVL